MSSKKQLIKDIERVSNIIIKQQKLEAEHERYLKKIIHDNQLIILAILVPVLIFSWNKREVIIQKISKIIKLILKSYLSSIVKQNLTLE